MTAFDAAQITFSRKIIAGSRSLLIKRDTYRVYHGNWSLEYRKGIQVYPLACVGEILARGMGINEKGLVVVPTVFGAKKP
jgi:hypothetical protein